MRGATPLDVAAASVMDNNELALALTESDLQKVDFTSTRPAAQNNRTNRGSWPGAALVCPLPGHPVPGQLWTEELPSAAG